MKKIDVNEHIYALMFWEKFPKGKFTIYCKKREEIHLRSGSIWEAFHYYSITYSWLNTIGSIGGNALGVGYDLLTKQEKPGYIATGLHTSSISFDAREPQKFINSCIRRGIPQPLVNKLLEMYEARKEEFEEKIRTNRIYHREALQKGVGILSDLKDLL